DLQIHVTSEDIALISMELENGALVSIVLSEVSHGHQNSIEYEIISNKHTYKWNSNYSSSFHITDNSNEVKTISNYFEVGFQETFKLFFQDVYKTITDPLYKYCFCDGEQASYNVYLCQMIYQSARLDGQWIKLDRSFDNE
ncbi:MAG: Gfo/Idh/MocA family oxidoreductase, partial [Bacilli bacterium]